MIKLIPLVPLFPLIGFLINGFFGKKISKSLSGMIASVSVLAAFVVSVLIFVELQGTEHKSNIVNIFSWINSDTLKIPFEFLVDPLSSVFLLIITGIGFLIHLYSIGYMKEDEGFARFFTYLNLFIFFMLLLVLGNNYLIMFVGWEGVGLCSYLLIGFWFKNTSYNNAARKAFVINRIGDLGFLLGILLIFVTFGSISFNEVFDKAGTVGGSVITSIALLLFIGAVGKSAQIPLYTWLPDAMAGSAEADHGCVGVGVDPRGHNGYRRYLHDRSFKYFLFHQRCSKRSRCDYRSCYGFVCRDDRFIAKRY